MMKIVACVLLLAVSANAALPTFKNKGGPADARGTWAGLVDGEYNVGIETSVGSYSYAYGKASGGTSSEFGKYLSYECIGKGQFRAIVEVTSVSPNGKTTKEKVCEYGSVNLENGVYKWASSSTKCPSTHEYTLTRSSGYNVPCEYTCK